MSISPSDPYVKALYARAHLGSAADAVVLAEQIAAACQPMAGGTDAILEISKAGRHKTADGHALGTIDVLLVLFRSELAVVQFKGIFKKTWEVQRIDYDSYARTLPDERSFGDKTGEFAIQFVGAGSVPVFRLGWSWWRRTLSEGTTERLKAAEERDRVLAAITAAKAGDFTPWGQVVNQPDNFVEDFREAYARLVAEGPTEANSVVAWAKQNIGDYAYPSALASAIEWREDELLDQRPPLERGGISARVARIRTSTLTTEKIPAAKRVYLGLGEALHNQGELAGPYDKRADFGPEVKDDSDRGLDSLDPGPSRLSALILLSAYGHDLGHPRTAEWIATIRAGLAAVPSSVLSPSVLRAWSRISAI